MARDPSILALLDRGLYQVSRPLLWATTWILRIGLRRIGLPARLDALAERQRAIEAALDQLPDSLAARTDAVQLRLEGVQKQLDALALAVTGLAAAARGRHGETTQHLGDAAGQLAVLQDRQVVPVGSGRLLVRTDDGFVVCPQDALAVIAALAWDDAHPCREVGLRALVRRLLRAGDVAMDLAPGLGLLALTMARAVGPEGRVMVAAGSAATGPLADTMTANGLEGRVSVLAATGGPADLRAADDRTMVLRLPDDAPVELVAGLCDLLSRSPDLVAVAALSPAGYAASPAAAMGWLSAARDCGFDRLMTVDPRSGRCARLPDVPAWVARGGGTLLLARADTAMAQRLPF